MDLFSVGRHLRRNGQKIGLILKDHGEYGNTSLAHYLEYGCKELDAWLPIDGAPKGKRGFLAIDKDRDSIEWLSDIGEDKFYNNNSNNFTDKSHWTHYKELPEDPK